SVGSSAETTGSPASGGKTPDRPCPSAWWQLLQFAPYTVTPSSLSKVTAPAWAVSSEPPGAPASPTAVDVPAPAAGKAAATDPASARPVAARTSGGGFQCWTP